MGFIGGRNKLLVLQDGCSGKEKLEVTRNPLPVGISLYSYRFYTSFFYKGVLALKG